MPPTIRNVVFELDLAAPQRVADERIRACLPADDPAPLWLRATEYGAEPTFDGSPAAHDGRRGSWRPFLAVIDRMVAAAEKEQALGSATRVWVTGRAGLPAFFYLGRQLQYASVTFLHAPAPRDDRAPAADGPPQTVLRLPLNATAQHTPYFGLVATRRTNGTGTVALVIRTESQHVEPGHVRDDLHAEGRNAVDVVDLVGGLLTEEVFGRAREQLRQCLDHIHRDYTERSELGLCLAGPSALAFLSGVMTVVNTHPRVAVFEQAERGRGRYRKAFVLPRSAAVPGPHVILCVEANPRMPHRTDEYHLRVGAEVREIQSALLTAQARGFEVQVGPAMRPHDLGEGLRRHAPRILHLAAHGREDAIVAENDWGLSHDLPVAALLEILGTAGDMVELVVLSACHSAAAAEQLATRGTIAIGYQGPVRDRSTLTFSRTLYSALAHGRNVDAAFRQAAAELTAQPGGIGADRPVLRVPAGIDATKLSFDPTGL